VEITEQLTLKDRVEDALNEIRPHLAVDGGNVQIVEITSGLVLRLKWIGTCENCNMSAMTMQAGIKEVIRNRVPEIIHVEAINGL
jgi:Fe-S cluster biogenesis protein NfuA